MHEAGDDELGLAITYIFESLEICILNELQLEVLIEHVEILQFGLEDVKKSDWDAIWQGYELEAVKFSEGLLVIFPVEHEVVYACTFFIRLKTFRMPIY